MTRAARRSSNLILIVVMVLVTAVGLVLRNASIASRASATDTTATAPAPENGMAPSQAPSTTADSERESGLISQDDLAGRAWKVVIYLALILAAILIGARLLKSYGGGRLVQASSPDIRILGRRHISQKQSIAMVRVRHKELLLGITDQSIHLLYDFTPEEEDGNGTEFAETPAEV